MVERVYIIPLGEVGRAPRRKRAAKAIRYIRKFLARHTKRESIVISNELNEEIWKRGIENIPRKVRVKVLEQADGSLVATLAEG